MEVRTKSPAQTLYLGRALGRLLGSGAVVALTGNLGAGKTVLAKGIALGVGVQDEKEVTSPSFVLVNEYRGRLPVYHVDLYRLQDPLQVEDLGWEEYISGAGVTLIEWAERAAGLLPDERIEVCLEWVSLEERKIRFVGKSEAAKEIIAQLGEKSIQEE